MLCILLIQEVSKLSEFPSWLTLGFLIFTAIVGAIILVWATKRKTVMGVTQNTVALYEAAIKSRDLKITDLNAEIEKERALRASEVALVKADLQRMSNEYATLAGINISKLLDYAAAGYDSAASARIAELEGVREALILAQNDCKTLRRRLQKCEEDEVHVN